MRSRWGGIACDNCPAVIRIKPRLSPRARRDDYLFAALLFVAILGPVSTIILASMNLFVVVPFMLVVLFSIAGFIVRSGLRVTESDMKMEQSDDDAEIIRMRPTCDRCGAALDYEDTLTCRKCGNISAEVTQTRVIEEHQVDIPETDVVGTCIVCNSNLDSADDLLFCPHCGRPAHKIHLLEWLHVKNRCPSCGEHIVEGEISKQLSQ
jgi:Zn finger protein HypA/HybF involved in hydrogenase expression